MNKNIKNQLWRIPLVVTIVAAILYLFIYLFSGLPEKSSITIYLDGLGKLFPVITKISASKIELPQILRIYDIPATFLLMMIVVNFFQSIQSVCRSEHFIDVISIKIRTSLIAIVSSIVVAILGLLSSAIILIFMFIIEFLRMIIGKNQKTKFIPIFNMVAAAIGSGLGIASNSGQTIGLLVMICCIVVFLLTGLLSTTGRYINKQKSRQFVNWLKGN